MHTGKEMSHLYVDTRSILRHNKFKWNTDIDNNIAWRADFLQDSQKTYIFERND